MIVYTAPRLEPLLDHLVEQTRAAPLPLMIDMSAASPTVYGVLVTRGTPTYSTTAAIKVKLTFGVDA